MNETMTPAEYWAAAGKSQKPKHKRKKKQSARDLFAGQLALSPIPAPFTELKFAKDQDLPRLWRFDFCWPDYMLAVEVEGLVVRRLGDDWVVQGRHATVKGFREDCVKYASATVLGWSVMRFEQKLIESGTALDMTWLALVQRGWEAPQ